MHLDPSTQQVSHGLPSAVQRLLRRRYFLTEKAKDANIIGGLPLQATRVGLGVLNGMLGPTLPFDAQAG